MKKKKLCKCGKPVLCLGKCRSCYYKAYRKKYDKKYYKDPIKLAAKRKRAADSYYRLHGKAKRKKYALTPAILNSKSDYEQ